jgi:uncharacterized damage-inducible protein DinB
MLLQSVAAILDRDLRTLRREVEAYPEERGLWQEVPGISNVAGTLVLHLAGNLQHYLGARLGQTGYVRDRAAEFARRDVPRAELLRQIEAARAAVKAALSSPAQAEVTAEYPETVGGSRVATGDYLIHLATHFAYHLGQVDYHRRVVTGSAVAVDAIRPSELSSAR